MPRRQGSARNTEISNGDLVLLRPEDVEGRLMSVTYAAVVQVRRNTINVNLLSRESDEVESILREIAEQRLVPTSEASTQLGKWLRKAVRVEYRGHYYYGQVVSYGPHRVTVATKFGDKEVKEERITSEVAPIIAMVMGSRRWAKPTWPEERLQDLENNILERLMEGRNGGFPTVKVWLSEWNRLFGDLSDLRYDWVDPLSGRAVNTSLHHAAIFAFYVDGQRDIPGSIEASLGTSFCDEPEVPGTPADDHPASNSSFFDPLDDDDSDGVRPVDGSSGSRQQVTHREPRDTGSQRQVSLLDGTELGRRPTSHSRASRQVSISLERQPDHGIQNRDEGATSVTDDVELIALIRQYKPYLLEHYLKQGSDRRPRPMTTGYEQGPEGDGAPASKRMRTSFYPTSDQLHVHRALTAERHQGKSIDSFLEYIVASPEANLYKHPGVVARLFDLAFGRGLSIKHFRRVGFLQKLQQFESEGINPSDFSVAAPSAPTPASWAELGSLARSLVDYTRAMCDSTTVKVAEALDTLINSLEGWQQCDVADLPMIVLWIDSLLARYRNAITYDTFHATYTRVDAASWFSASNPELQTLLISAVRERLRVSEAVSQSVRVGPTREVTKFGSDRKIPSDVVAAIPTKDDKEVCLHFLSKRGCKSRDSEKCTFKDRVHFWPSSIPTKLRQYINKRLGGIRTRPEET